MSTLEQPEIKTPAPAPPAPQRRRRAPVQSPRLRWRRNRLAYWLIAPAVVFMVLVHLLPMLGGLYLSFKKLNTFTFSQLWGAPWNGLENYRSILFDSENPLHSGFMEAVGNTIQYTFFTVAGTLGGGLAIAVLLNRQMRGIKVVRTLMLTPWVVPIFVVPVPWGFMWQSDNGIINNVLRDYTRILSDRPVSLIATNSIWAIIIPSIWRGLPFAMLIFLAGLQAIPDELNE